MKWFTGLNNHNKSSYDDYIKMYKVAVFSAKKTNPTLEPYLILDGEIDNDIQTLIDLGVNVIKHQVLFYDDVIRHYKDDTVALGVFLRIDIPKICEKLNISDEYILYTDNDVFFMDDISDLNNLTPKFFAACGEFSPFLSPMNMNSGVMLINWRNMLTEYDLFVEYIVKNFSINMYDQDPLKKFYNGRITILDPHYNYRTYWGPSNNIKILHYHGPKPTYNDDKIKNYHHPGLITPFYFDSKQQFLETLEMI
jgi:lipopolysaccharide biosynthesis glycosyltransferase